ncbi:MAG: 16S rRNA (uracil(1498)-N(3))-methyltransferase [Oscillospiraceae bacterium]|jgi:16S rRNA (uracil1498-N3)-methyltransferase|nr:16S rRNA (uracil(1498)-N(3))-methyltransferase [Oscillospiraceae bacterium]
MRFFIDFQPEIGSAVLLSREDAHHCNVLRYRVGDELTLCDGAGNDYICRLDKIGRDEVQCIVLSRFLSTGEPSARLEVFCAIPKGDKAAHIVRKATELGAAGISFFSSERTIGKLKSSDRYSIIAREAAMQSGRGIIPPLRLYESFEDALTSAETLELRLFCWEEERVHTLKNALNGKAPASVAIVTGAEGGFTTEEAQLAESRGFELITLGTRILRCETAPLAVLSAITLLGDF